MQFFMKPAMQQVPWNKGKLIGQKPPLQLKHVWAIRTILRLDGHIRDLALFNLAIDSKLRGCDVVSLKVEDVAVRVSSRVMRKGAERGSGVEARVLLVCLHGGVGLLTRRRRFQC